MPPLPLCLRRRTRRSTLILIPAQRRTRRSTPTLTLTLTLTLLAQTHSALDQREKVKTKFMSAQRDAQQEREMKLGIIKELISRAGSLDDDWGLRQAEMEEIEEQRRERQRTSNPQPPELRRPSDARLRLPTLEDDVQTQSSAPR